MALPDRHKQTIQLGLSWWRAIVRDGLGETDCTAENGPFPHQSWSTLNQAFLVAVRSGSFHLTRVERDPDLEQAILSRYPELNRVLVAAVPRLRDGAYSIKAATVRTELVSFLAATQALLNPSLRAQPVGIGGGYTVLRIAEQSPPTLDFFTDTQWIPLQATQDPALDIPELTAQYTAMLLASRHRGSKAVALPFVPIERRQNLTLNNPDLSPAERCAAQAIAQLDNTKTFLMSVSGKNLEYPAIGPGFASTLLQDCFRALERVGRAGEFAGALVGWVLNHEGKPIGGEPMSRAVFAVELEAIRRTVRFGTVWLVAAGSYKGEAVRMVVTSGLANALVIDASIADHLLT